MFSLFLRPLSRRDVRLYGDVTIFDDSAFFYRSPFDAAAYYTAACCDSNFALWITNDVIPVSCSCRRGAAFFCLYVLPAFVCYNARLSITARAYPRRCALAICVCGDVNLRCMCVRRVERRCEAITLCSETFLTTLSCVRAAILRGAINGAFCPKN